MATNPQKRRPASSRARAAKQSKLGRAIQRWREERGLTMTEFAREMGVELGTASDWEWGRCRPDVSRFQRMASVLNTTSDALLKAAA